MKKQITKHVLFFGMALLLMAGCNMDTKTKDKKDTADSAKVASVEVEVFDAVKIKDQIVETIRKMPSEKEIATLLNESGASYILDLTVPANQAEKLMTESDQSFGLGLYSFDLIYASVYNRGDKAAETSRISEQLIDRLGLRNDLTSSKNYLDRIKKNNGNKDSLDFLVTQNLNHFHQQMSKGDQPDVYALSVIGSNVEALYILSQSTLMAKNNAKMLDIMSRQNERVKGVFTLLELMSGDENIKPYYEQFKPAVTIFEENPKITEKELAQIAPIMETVRQNILK
ncbi:MAG: hypothetical protein H7X84_07960 [Verrucomicrobia bacterium]|nr:hypothetical protein [Prolixibacteraceae bacterium]